MLEKLPPEVVIIILKCLSFNEQVRLGRVSKRWQEFTQNPVLFENLEFEGISPESKYKMTPKQLTEFIMNKLSKVDYVYSINFTDIMRLQTIDEIHFRLMIIKCPFAKHLRILKLYNVDEDKTIKTIADFCPKLSHLTIDHLRLETNCMKRIANQCKSLQHLSLNAKETQAPATMQPLDDCLRTLSAEHLKFLHLRFCHISAPTIRNMLRIPSKSNEYKSYLEHLIIEDCSVNDQFVDEVLNNGLALQTLRLENASKMQPKRIITNESNLTNLKHLRNLSLARNGILMIQATLPSLNLVHLDLSSNCLKEIPESIFSCWLLKELYLGKNELEIVPNDLLKLKNLEVLDLHENKFVKSFPPIEDVIYTLKRMKKCNLQDTPFEKLEKEFEFREKKQKQQQELQQPKKKKWIFF